MPETIKEAIRDIINVRTSSENFLLFLTSTSSMIFMISDLVYSLFLFTVLTTSNITCSFSSSFTIYETQYKCTVGESEFNYSLNPTTISGSSNDGTVYNYVTSSFFSPYVTTVGMYNNNNELLAVGKLAQPLPTSRTTDTTILVNIDRQ